MLTAICFGWVISYYIIRRDIERMTFKNQMNRMIRSVSTQYDCMSWLNLLSNFHSFIISFNYGLITNLRRHSELNVPVLKLIVVLCFPLQQVSLDTHDVCTVPLLNLFFTINERNYTKQNQVISIRHYSAYALSLF